ncbi:hypothetical protein F4810DRAFT_726384 [Camillea tinctor]|nr:hypothetical protein F4810DRAFT_726384 [Camillea tinctor]
MLPGQVIANQLLQPPDTIPSPSPLPTPSNSSIPLSSPDRSCSARTLPHSPAFLAALALPAGQDVVYAHRRSGNASEAGMCACCAPSQVAYNADLCVLWCVLPARLVDQMRTADGDYVTAPFTSCLEHAYFADEEKGEEIGSENEVVQQSVDADEVFGPVAVRPGDETSGAGRGPRGVRTGWRARVLGMGMLGVLVPWLLTG